MTFLRSNFTMRPHDAAGEHVAYGDDVSDLDCERHVGRDRVAFRNGEPVWSVCEGRQLQEHGVDKHPGGRPGHEEEK
eukprot:CAMPEP_0114505202 /NCGR_PEP_ID=MMETSP0109-20121206/10722_1 /TAXON_ID=29199 /ORGANISM="Chlorarachnion reptans, Strain CCCM449" /LENGTH=76 /DNA_ID=CAMNT_0001683615 /DNA_START=1464 /DNA_END=1691 /DNA_ORIENTATION=-